MHVTNQCKLPCKKSWGFPKRDERTSRPADALVVGSVRAAWKANERPPRVLVHAAPAVHLVRGVSFAPREPNAGGAALSPRCRPRPRCGGRRGVPPGSQPKAGDDEGEVDAGAMRDAARKRPAAVQAVGLRLWATSSIGPRSVSGSAGGRHNARQSCLTDPPGVRLGARSSTAQLPASESSSLSHACHPTDSSGMHGVPGSDAASCGTSPRKLQQQRMLEAFGHPPQEADRVGPVDQAVVVRQRQRQHRPGLEPVAGPHRGRC